MNILTNHHSLRGIPLLEFYDSEFPARLPLVLLMHGFSGRKEDCSTPAYLLAQRGCYAVSFDLHLHGESSQGEFIPANIAPRLAEVIEHSLDHLHLLVDEYAHHPFVDSSRVGLLGFSLGGSFIYNYLPNRQEAVRAAVANIAGAQPFWPITLRRIMQYYPEFGLTEDLVARMEQASTPAVFFYLVSLIFHC
jgi:alpha-beta hydrolase superfamily lysophospholipase